MRTIIKKITVQSLKKVLYWNVKEQGRLDLQPNSEMLLQKEM